MTTNEKATINKWQRKISEQGQYNEIEVVIAYRTMIREGYNSLGDMLETLKVICSYNIYETILTINQQNNNDIFIIDGKYYFIQRPKK